VKKKTRWAEDIEKLRKESEMITGNTIVSCGMLAYAGPFT